MTKSVLITGASRGIGAHLARQFAARGYTLALTGRQPSTLEALASELRGQSPHIVVQQLDVEDYASIPAAIRQCAASLGGLDIIIANAGIAQPTPAGKGHIETIRQIINVDLLGAIATAEAAIELFREQGQGQLVGITSVAGARGIRRQSAYCASKAGFGRYLQSLRLETHGQAIVITELAPGFIDTDLNRGIPSRPFVISVEKGARIMAELIERRVNFSYVPRWPWMWLAPLLKLAPDSLLRRM